MIGTLPISRLAPLDYRYALDGALTLLAGFVPDIRCDQPELTAELAQRLPGLPGQPGAVLWIEPQRTNWQTTLNELHATCAIDAPLVIVASQPLARLLPERRAWSGAPLGLSFGGITRLHHKLRDTGLRIEAVYGAHSLSAILLNSAGRLIARAGRPDLGDRLEFAARLHYGAQGRAAALATVVIILAYKTSRQ